MNKTYTKNNQARATHVSVNLENKWMLVPDVKHAVKIVCYQIDGIYFNTSDKHVTVFESANLAIHSRITELNEEIRELENELCK